MKLSTYSKRLGLSYQTVWRHFHKGLIPRAYQLPTGTVIVPDDIFSSNCLAKDYGAANDRGALREKKKIS